jgi:alkanesulfonate monooxygenase SsuD/methylene tetrahydromethanopterin reductase-like flavin-dependent oxidoreductase (luciferase family)
MARRVTRADFDAQRTREGALLVGDAEEVVEKIVRYNEALGGISRLSFQMNAGLMRSSASHRSDWHPRRPRAAPRTRRRI